MDIFIAPNASYAIQEYLLENSKTTSCVMEAIAFIVKRVIVTHA